MKRLILAILAFTAFSSSVRAGCGEDQVSVPLVDDGKEACYRLKGPLAINTEKIKEGALVDFEITPIAASFRNIPEPQVYNFLSIEYSSDQKASKVQLMGFLCSGEIPIAGDALGDSLKKISEKDEKVTSEIRVFIATGQAAENISVSQEKKARAKVFDKFLEIYESKISGVGSIEEELSNIFIPNIIAGISPHFMSENDRKLYSAFFSRTSSSINGCSAKFRATMQEYLLENVVRYRPFPGIEVKKKPLSSSYRMRWML